jgi:hypothetical protein
VSITRIAWVKIGVAAVQGLELEVPVRNRGRSYRSGNDPGRRVDVHISVCMTASYRLPEVTETF